MNKEIKKYKEMGDVYGKENGSDYFQKQYVTGSFIACRVVWQEYRQKKRKDQVLNIK